MKATSRVAKLSNTRSDTRQALLAAARKEFLQEGYFDTDTNKIARKAGVAAGSFYNHFQDKREIFIEVYNTYVADLLEIFKPVLDVRVDLDVYASVISSLVEHHHRWRRFRSSLGMLVASDPKVKAVKQLQRRRQVDFLIAQIGGRKGTTGHFSTAVAVALVKCEAVLDALASGDLAELGADRQRVIHLVREDFVRLIAELKG
jgi:AcrR family transcriptional regulator